MLEKLTKEQEELIDTVREEYLAKFYNVVDIDMKKVRPFIDNIYKKIDLPPPEIVVVDSPVSAQYYVHMLRFKSEIEKCIDVAKQNFRKNLSVFTTDESKIINFIDDVRSNYKSDSKDYDYTKLGTLTNDELIKVNSVVISFIKEVEDNVDKLVNKEKVQYTNTGYNLTHKDLGFIAYYDYYTRIEIINDPLFNEYKEFADLGIYDSIQLKGYFIAVRQPIIKRKGSKVHSEDSKAIEFKDGYGLYMWNGTEVPEQLIMSPETITQKDIKNISNAEVRRCYMERLGASKYYDLLSNGVGCKLIDSTIDDNGNVMKLWETVMDDDIVKKKVQFLECECPSTGRIYNIYPPNQQSKTCIEAKRSTFSNKKLTYRHGDVGLRMIDEEQSEKIEIET